LLLHAVHAAEAFINHHRRKMGTVIALHLNLGIGESGADQVLELLGVDGHGGLLSFLTEYVEFTGRACKGEGLDPDIMSGGKLQT